MQKLLTSNITQFFECLLSIKDCYDYCDEDVSGKFSDFSYDGDEYEAEAFEQLYNIPFLKESKELYYEDDEKKPVEEREAVGEELIFTSEEMDGYYKLLDKLLETEKITVQEYRQRCGGMEQYILDYILYGVNHYSGLYVTLYYAKNETEENKLIVEVPYYDGYYSMFELYCGIIQLFDKYKSELKKLKYRFGFENNIKEAA